jgi:leucyl aminopeptidase (aminopeptidase T)
MTISKPIPSLDELAADARLVVESCLSVQPGDVVTVVFDATHEPQARATAKAAKELGARILLIDNEDQIGPIRNDHGLFPGAPLAPLHQAMITSDHVVISTETNWHRHLWFAMWEATQEAQRRGVKVAYLENDDMGTWNLEKSDVDEISERTRRGAALLERVDTVRVTSPAGTDVTLSLAGRTPIAVVPVVERGQMMSPVPIWGELTMAPVETAGDGRIVFDASMFGQGVIAHEETVEAQRVRPAWFCWDEIPPPVAIELRNGRVVDVIGDSREADDIRETVRDIRGADTIGEFALGTSHVAEPTNPGRLGTAHFALGDNLIYLGKIASAWHQNGVCLDASVQVVETGEWIVKDGQWML